MVFLPARPQGPRALFRRHCHRHRGRQLQSGFPRLRLHQRGRRIFRGWRSGTRSHRCAPRVDVGEFAAIARDAGAEDSDAVARQFMMLRDGGMVNGYLGEPAELADTLKRGFDAVLSAAIAS